MRARQEYVNPFAWSGEVVKTLVTSNPDHQNAFNGWSPFRWTPDYPGLAGKDLSPKGPITDIHDSVNASGAGDSPALPTEEEY
jgi:hypothetical protein